MVPPVGPFVVGDQGNDTITADAAALGEQGNDTISTIYPFGAFISGGLGNDTIEGNAGADRLFGDAGEDFIWGHGDNDLIYGGAGNDTLNGGPGADRMTGGLGNDKFIVDNAADIVVEAMGEGTADRVYASVSYQLAAGAQVEILNTSSDGGTGAINLVGNNFAQTIIGNAGNNVINGLGGADTMSGLGGNDTFMFNTALGGGNIDAITDFNVANDTIRLENAIFTAILGTGVLTAAQFVKNATGAAQDASDRIIYETDTGRLIYDANGSTAGGAVQFATLDAGLALTSADFFIV